MRTLLLILLLILSSCLGVPLPGTPPVSRPDTPPAQSTARYGVQIDSAALITQDGPALAVSGMFTDGCDFPVSTEIAQNGTTITVDIYRTGPPDAVCPAIIVSYRDTLPLPDLMPGVYTITVNGYTLEGGIGAGGMERPTPESPGYDPPAAIE